MLTRITTILRVHGVGSFVTALGVYASCSGAVFVV